MGGGTGHHDKADNVPLTTEDPGSQHLPLPQVHYPRFDPNIVLSIYGNSFITRYCLHPKRLSFGGKCRVKKYSYQTWRNSKL